MRVDIAGFAIGVLTGLAGFIALAIAINYLDIRSTQWCDAGETMVVCARQWAHVLAIIGAFVTVFIISAQIRTAERHHVANMKLQTLEMRAEFARAISQFIEPIELRSLRSLAVIHDAIWENTKPPPPADLLDMITRRADLERSYVALKRFDDGEVHEALQFALRATDAATNAITGVSDLGARVVLSRTTERMLYLTQDSLEACHRYCHVFRQKTGNADPDHIPTVRKRSSLAALFKQG